MTKPPKQSGMERRATWWGQFWHTFKTMHQALTIESEDGEVARGCFNCSWGAPEAQEWLRLYEKERTR